MPFTNPLVAGTTLIRTAIKSPNYVAGVSGWAINKDGSAEFNNVVVRGTVSAGGGVVVLDSAGVDVKSIGGTEEFLVNRSGGFVAAHIPDDGAKIQITTLGVFLTPADPSPHGNAVDFASLLVAYDNSGLVNEAPVFAIQGVEYTGKSAPVINMIGQAANDPNPDDTSRIDITTREARITSENLTDNHSHQYLRGENAQFLASWGGVDFFTIAVTFTHPFSQAPEVNTNIPSGAGAVSRWGSRATGVSTTGFTFFAFASVAGATTTGTSIPMSWVATEYTP